MEYPVLDTVLNFLIFGFVGLMVALVVRTPPPPADD